MSAEHDRLAETLETLRSLVAFDTRTLFDENGSLLPAQLWPREASLAVTSIVSRELFSEGRLVGVEHRVRLSDRVRALELALKEMGSLAGRAPPPETLEEMTDAQLISVIYEVKGVSSALEAAGSTINWQNASPEQIDQDYTKITAYYDLLRPSRRSSAALSSPAPAQRMLPSPTPDVLRRQMQPQRRPLRP